MFFAALGLVQPDQHRWIFGNSRQQAEPIAGAVPAKNFILPPHEVGALHLLHAGGEMTVPEESQLFLQRTRSESHSLQPPITQILDLFALLSLLLLAHLLLLFRRSVA